MMTPETPITPDDIRVDKHYWDAFDHCETEISAGWLVRFAQARGKGWEPFTRDEIEKFYHKDSGGKFSGFRFNRLIHAGTAFYAARGTVMEGGGWITEDRDGVLSFTRDFVERCRRAAGKVCA